MAADQVPGFIRAEGWRQETMPLRKNRGVVAKRQA
jgi:hypothetical protein